MKVLINDLMKIKVKNHTRRFSVLNVQTQ